MRSSALTVTAICLSLLAPATHAGEFFVDVASGSDSNPGTSPAAAWKTLTHALATAVSAIDTVHVAAGDYSAASGEVFPLQLGPARVVGDQGPAVTRIIGSGAEVLVEGAMPGSLLTYRLEGFSLIQGTVGLRIQSTNGPASVACKHLVIVDMSDWGVDFAAHSGTGATFPAAVEAFFHTLDIADCGGGVRLATSTPTAPSILGLVNSSIHDSAGDGIRIDSTAGGKVALSLNETRVLRQGQSGVRVQSSGFTQLLLSSCLVADNATGLHVANDGGEVQLDLFFSTVAGQDGSGLHVDTGLPAVSDIAGAIFWGNGEDVTGGSVVTATDSDSEDGAFGTLDGNFSADPLFRGAASGDYRLSFGSPCIEAGDPGFASGVLDIDGAQRPADGDLDTIEELDIGCFEFNPLVVETTGELGTQVVFEGYGMPCMLTTLFFAPGEPAAVAKKTGFGLLRIGPSGILPLLVTIVLSPAPSLTVATIPQAPELVGLTFSFQSLTQSLEAPKGAALTNVASLTVID